MLNRSPIEIPFPTPFDVIWWPIHMSRALPVFMVMTAWITFHALKS